MPHSVTIEHWVANNSIAIPMREHTLHVHNHDVDLVHHCVTTSSLTLIVTRTLGTPHIIGLRSENAHGTMNETRVVLDLVLSAVPYELGSTPLNWTTVYATSFAIILFIALGLTSAWT